MSDLKYLDQTPTLKAHLLQYEGLEAVSFRKFVVRTKAGKYWKTEGELRIDIEHDDKGVARFTIRCAGIIEPPDDEKAELIKSELAAAKWPTLKVLHRLIRLPENLAKLKDHEFDTFRDVDGGIIMLQVRRENDDGTKDFFPWTYWSDDQWRSMEPDGKLPLYNLEHLKDQAVVFIHEGTKAARKWQRLSADALTFPEREELKAHPWGGNLTHAAHIGWIGGAPNPRRTDWGPLRRLGKDTRFYLVADNDFVGTSAISKISEMVRHKMTAIVFDDNFDGGFDLADEWPRKSRPEWWNGDRYLGPTFHDMCRPATWATNMSKPKKGKPKAYLRDEFKDEWLMAMTPHLLAHRDLTDRLYTPEVFNRAVAPFSDVEDVVKLLAKEVSTHAVGIDYRPTSRNNLRRVITVDGVRLINTYRPPSIEPEAGDAKPFEDFMTYLFPDEGDRGHVMKWCATLVARPETRMRYALLLISETQGVGKTSLIDSILAPLVGRWNTSSPNEHQVTESGFNGWIAQKRLASINEIYSGQSRKCYDRLKQVISDDTVQVNQKYVEEYTIENHVHVAACSNSIRALHIDDGDRRWLVPRVTEELKPHSWWTDFHTWLKGGGLPIIAHWAEEYVRQHGAVRTGDRAPDSSAKREIVAASRTEGAQMAFELAGEIADMKARNSKPDKEWKAVILVDDVRAWVAGKRGMGLDDRRLETPHTLRKALVEGGLIQPDRDPLTNERRIKIEQRWRTVLATFRIDAGTKWPALEALRKRPADMEVMEALPPPSVQQGEAA